MKTLNSLNFDAGFQCIGTNYFYAVVDDGKSRDDGDYYFGGGGDARSWKLWFSYFLQESRFEKRWHCMEGVEDNMALV
jgi:hypothetical protein